MRTTSTLESESFLQSDNSNDRQAASTVRKSCTTKQEQVLYGQLLSFLKECHPVRSGSYDNLCRWEILFCTM